MNNLRILFFGDIIGKSGRALFQKHIGRLRLEYNADAVLINGENSSSFGRGISSRIMKFFRHNGVDVVTSGNHIWHNREIYSYWDQNTDLLRPANYPSGCPGIGVTTFDCKGKTIGVINLQGRVFMRDHVECPFKTAESILTYLKTKTNIILVDFHAEATSEKMGLAYFLDGQVSSFVGTHTHVQRADERILPGGTAYITDLGMSGSLNSMIGMVKEPVIRRLINQMPVKFTVDTRPPFVLSGVCIEVDMDTGKSVAIQRISIIDDQMQIDTKE